MNLCFFLLMLFQDPLSGARFSMERQGLQLDPAKQAITINAEGPDLSFRLVYETEFATDMRVMASLVGPSLSSPMAIDQAVEDGKLVLDRGLFTQEGIYQLMDTRLVQGAQVLAYAEPSVAEIQVAEKFVVTDVQVRELGEDELNELGYIFNEDDYYSVNFNLSFQVAATTETVTVDVPTVFPKFENTTFEPAILQDPFKPHVIAVPFFTEPTIEDASGALPVEAGGGGGGDPPPRIPGLVLIPGNFKYLKSIFNVTVITLNAAPDGFDVQIDDLQAKLVLPGPVASGELPLTIDAPTGQLMVHAGPDGEAGTADDRTRIEPGEQASAEYILRGNVPGMHPVEILIEGDVDLPQGTERVYSSASSTVYVRSPEFAVSFSHPDTVAEDEVFDLDVHITNKGETDLNQFTMTLDPDLMVGVGLHNTLAQQGPITIPQGGEASIRYQLRSRVTGSVQAGFFKAGQSVGNQIELRVGVGQLGERLSPYVLEFPQQFRDGFPSALTDELMRYARRALDVGLTADHELPGDLVLLSPAVVRAFNSAMALTAAYEDFGATDREKTTALFALWARSLEDHDPLDRVRRKVLAAGDQQLEEAFGNALASVWTGMTPSQILETLSQDNEETAGLMMWLVDGDLEVSLRDGEGRITDSAGAREIPFASIIPLSATRKLIWLSAATSAPTLTMSPGGSSSGNVIASFPNTQGQQLLASMDALDVSGGTALIADMGSGQLVARTNAGGASSATGVAVPTKPFELVTVRQMAPTDFDGNVRKPDFLGRTHLLHFSKAVDLRSMVPLSEHVFINGEPVVEGFLQEDGRSLIVSSKMPLGPYHTIDYELRNVAARDGQELSEAGSYEGHPFFVGVSITGRVVDRNGRDLRDAKMFLWLQDTIQDPELRRQAAEGAPVEVPEGFRWRILNQKTLDTSDSYLFEYAPFIPFDGDSDVARRYRTFKVGVLMPDGLYEERTITPLGAGQEVVVDFAFLGRGSVQGHVLDGDGLPVPFATVFVISQHNNQSGEITTTDETGYYRVDDVEVGNVLVKTAVNGIVGLGSAYLTEANSPVTVDLTVDQPAGAITGQITASLEGQTIPVDGAAVGFALQGGITNRITLVRDFSVPYSVFSSADAQGRFQLDNVPAGTGEFWIYHPFYEFVSRTVVVNAGETLNLDQLFEEILDPRGVVTGRILDEYGVPVVGAEVSLEISQARVLSDSAGTYRLENVPLNKSLTIQAVHPDFRGGSAAVFLSSETQSGVDIVLHGPIRITGEYLDALGQPIPFAQVYQEGYYDGNGFTAARVIAQSDFAGQWEAVLDDEGITQITGYRPPRIAAATVTAQAGAHVVLQEIASSKLRVRLLDGYGQPINAKVYLKTMQPSANATTLGAAGLGDHVPVFTDIDGYALFEDLNAGDFEVYGALNDLGQTPLHTSTLPALGPEDAPHEVVLSFPRPEEEANLFGTVLEADGSPAPLGTLVKVTVEGQTGYREVDGTGYFRFDELVTTSDPRRVQVVAYNPDTDHYATAWLDLHQDLNFRLDMTLRRKGTLNVHVVDANGDPVDFAAVQVIYTDVTYVPPAGAEGDFGDVAPGTKIDQGQLTPSEPVYTVADMPTGPFVVKANSGNGFAGLRAYAMPLDGGTLDVTVRLEAASSISGVFYDHNEIPIAEAEVQLLANGDLLAQHVTAADPAGSFLFDQLPMRTYQLRGTNPADNLKANLEVTTSPYQPHRVVDLRLDPIAHLEGYVYQGSEVVPNARVELKGGGLTILTGTDATGRFRFRNLPLRTYELKASSPFVVGSASRSVVLAQNFATEERDLYFADELELDLHLLTSSGLPAQNVLMQVFNTAYGTAVGNSGISDSNGIVHLTDLVPGTYKAVAQHPSELSRLEEIFTITANETQPISRQLAFTGWGAISGFVTDTLGQPLPEPVTVKVGFAGESAAVSTDSTGYYRIGRIPIGDNLKLSAFNPATKEVATATVSIDHHGAEVNGDLQFQTATYVRGTVSLPDGSPAAYVTVTTDGAYALTVQTDALGRYELEPILEGTHTVIAQDPNSPRKAARDVTVTTDGSGPVPVTDADLVLSGVAAVSGLVSYSDGTPLQYGSVKLYSADLHATLTTIIQGDGSFHLGQVPLGQWSLSAHDDVYATTSASFTLDVNLDGGSFAQNIVFPDAFNLSGVVYAADQATAVSEATVKLWRPRVGNSNAYDLIYTATTGIDGSYEMAHVYPGNYLLEAENALLTEDYRGELLMTTSDVVQPVYLVGRTWIEGTVQDANGLPLAGTVSLSQFGRVTNKLIAPDGGFSFDGLSAAPYSLAYNVSGGWMQGSASGVLTNGLNTLPIVTGPTLTLQGQAILAREPAAHPTVTLSKGGIQKSVSLNPSGLWQLDAVPANEPLTLTLRHGSAHRQWSLGSFGANANVGTYYLDAIGPDLQFAAEGTPVTQLPLTLSFQVDEPQVDSSIDTSATRVWVNGVDLSHEFITTQVDVAATFAYLPAAFVLGDNTIEVEVFNDSHVATRASYALDVQLAGTTLVVNLTSGGNPIVGDVGVDGGAVVSSDSNGTVILNGLAPGDHVLAAYSGDQGLRSIVTLGNAVTQQATLELVPVGAYRGLVFDLDGQPAANATVVVDGFVVQTDSNGLYHFDLLPMGDHDISASHDQKLAWRAAPELSVPGQVLLNVDLQLVGTGTVNGIVYDDDGITPMADTVVDLSFQTWPTAYNQATSTDANGAFQFQNVPTEPLVLSALHAPSQRAGFAQGQVPAHGSTLPLDITLSPSGDLTGVVLDDAGNPAENLTVSATALAGTVTTVTDASGAFSFTNLPYGDYTLSGERAAELDYFSVNNTVALASQDLGSLTLQTDQPPWVTNVVIPNPLNPGQNPVLELSFADDRHLDHYSLVFSGVHTGEITGSLDPEATASAYPNAGTSIDTPDGTVNWTLTVTDHFGQTGQQTGSFEVLGDGVGPDLSLAKPAENFEVAEGNSFSIQAGAIDLSGINYFRVYFDEVLIHDTDSRNIAITHIAPGVDADTEMVLRLEAQDGVGNISELSRTILVKAANSAGAPALTLLAPALDQPMPLDLAAGLQLRVAAQADDPDGLQEARVYLDGVLSATQSLSGTNQLVDVSITLPEDLRSASSIDVALEVTDLGGNLAATSTRVTAFGEAYTVFDATTPLVLPAYDLTQDGNTLVLAGGTHTIDGDHSLAHLLLVNDAILTQTETAVDQAFIARTHIAVTGTLVVDHGSAVDVNGKGYHHAPQELGMGLGDPSHGGLGTGATDLAGTYGSPFQPTLPGSHQGGGAMRLNADQFWLVGHVRADGVPNPSNHNGSGGSIWLQANQYHGQGTVSANGFAGTYAATTWGGGGGRVAIYGAFDGTVEAFGGRDAGAGSIYLYQGDPNQSDGVADALHIAAHSDATLIRGSAIHELGPLTVGTDVFLSTQMRDNASHDVLDFPVTLPHGAFVGQTVFRNGLALGTLSDQELTRLWSQPDVSFGLAEGDVIHVGYAVDQLVVTNDAEFHLQGQSPRSLLVLNNGNINGGDETVDLDIAGISMVGNAHLHGIFSATTLTIPPGASLSLDGGIDLDTFHLTETLTLDGRINATQYITVDSGALVTTFAGKNDAFIELYAPTITITGDVRANGNGDLLSPDHDFAHGGLAGWTAGAPLPDNNTYGSLYAPTNGGTPNGGGGRITLNFDTLTLNGDLNADAGDQGSGGAVVLQGQTLSGSGALSANGAPTFYTSGGGGRVAVHVNDTSAFSGNATAFGGTNSVVERAGGAGTVFWRTDQWPNGRLVLDNNGQTTLPATTLLPGLGERTVGAATGGASIEGVDYPTYHGLTGLLIQVAGHTPVPIDYHTTTQLYPAGTFPTLNPGDTYSGLHRLDILELRGGANLKSIDPIEVVQDLIVESGQLDIPGLQLPPTFVFQDGALDLSVDPGLSSLSLDNFQLTARFPMGLDTLNLSNGSVLTYDDPLTVTGDITVDGSTLVDMVEGSSTGLSGASLTLNNGAQWIVADRKQDGEAYPIRANLTGALTLHVGTTISTSGDAKLDSRNHTWAGAPLDSRSHGGFGIIDNIRPEQPLMGSFAYPDLYGGANGGGLIHINAGSMVLNGTISANGGSRGNGGSILLQSGAVSGSGTVEAMGGHNGQTRESRRWSYSGGGRVAIYHDGDRSFLDTLQLNTREFRQGGSVIAGAGTVFVKGANQTHGELLIDQATTSTEATMLWRSRLSGVAGIDGLTMGLDDADPAPNVITDASWPVLPPGLAGLHLRLTIASTTYDVPILANTHNSITVDGTLPATIPAGTQLELVLRLDRLALQGGAQFHFPGTLEAASIEFATGMFNSLWVGRTESLPNPFQINDRAVRLILDQPDLSNHDISLTNGQLLLDKPLTIRDLNLTNSTLRHSRGDYGTPSTVIFPELNLNARHITLDASSAFDVSQTYADPAFANHGGIGTGSNITYGNLFQPTRHGNGPVGYVNGGGRMHVQASSITGGIYRANGSFGAAGSVWLDADSFVGNVDVQAYLTGGSGGGGRIAVYHNGLTNANLTTRASGSVSAGTVYLHDKTQPRGTLVLDNAGLTPSGTYANITPLPGFAPTSLSGVSATYDGSSQTTTLSANSLGLTMDYGGHHLVANSDWATAWPILSSSESGGVSQFILNGDATSLTNGTLVQAGAWFSDLQSCASCTLDPGNVLVQIDSQAKMKAIDPELESYLTQDGDLEIIGTELVLENLSHDGAIYLENTRLVITGRLEAQALHLGQNSVLTTLPQVGEHPEPLVLMIRETLEIAKNARIDLDGLGLQPQRKPSHGGLASGADLHQLTDAPIYPTQPGGGEQGGGALYIAAAHVRLLGQIRANGLGFSAGGAVQIATNIFEGNGQILVLGGNHAEQIAGGGRVAIHSPHAFRFTGQIHTGLNAPHRGSIVFRNPATQALQVAQSWPADPQAPPMALLPALTLRPDAIRATYQNQQGSLLEVDHHVDLTAYAGTSLSNGTHTYLIQRIVPLAPNRYLLQLNQHLTQPAGPYHFQLPAQQAPPTAQGAIPLKPME